MDTWGLARPLLVRFGYCERMRTWDGKRWRDYRAGDETRMMTMNKADGSRSLDPSIKLVAADDSDVPAIEAMHARWLAEKR